MTRTLDYFTAVAIIRSKFGLVGDRTKLIVDNQIILKLVHEETAYYNQSGHLS